jgi:hypothetical protein
MTEVDPEDESLARWVVQRYRYDAERRERRNVDEVAFDTEKEFLSYVERAAGRLVQEKAAGAAEEIERYSGVYRGPGHREFMHQHRRGRGSKG